MERYCIEFISRQTVAQGGIPFWSIESVFPIAEDRGLRPTMRRSEILVSMTLLWVVTTPRAIGQFLQQGAKLVGAGGISATDQGAAVAVSAHGNTAVVGGPDDNNAIGAVWVFTRTGGAWNQQGG